MASPFAFMRSPEHWAPDYVLKYVLLALLITRPASSFVFAEEPEQRPIEGHGLLPVRRMARFADDRGLCMRQLTGELAQPRRWHIKIRIAGQQQHRRADGLERGPGETVC